MIQCDLETVLLQPQDFDCIGDVARHCDWNKLCIYIKEQQNLMLMPKIGQCLYIELYNYLENSDSSTDNPLMEQLWCGGQYTGCNGEPALHFGLKRILACYAYGVYQFRHGYQDTPFGMVQKVNEDSMPAPLPELRKIMQEYQNAANEYWEMTREFLCANKTEEPFAGCLKNYFGCSTCKKDYRCNTCCTRGGKIGYQDRGINFANISKYEKDV